MINKLFIFNDNYHRSQVSTSEDKSLTVETVGDKTTSSLSREERRELKIDEVKSECESLRINIDELQSNIKQLNNKLSQVDITLNNEEREFNRSEERRKIKARTYDLLDDGEGNVKKLEAVIEASANKLASLAAQWERHRRPLIERYRDERSKYSTKAVSVV